MITSIHIENFKSIQSLDLELGRLNVFIGANGSGKSNILEAIAMGCAAMENKVDDEFLFNRGVRVTEPRLMKSGFEKNGWQKSILMKFLSEEFTWDIELSVKGEHDDKWSVNGGVENLVNQLEIIGGDIKVAENALNQYGKKHEDFGAKLNELAAMIIGKEIIPKKTKTQYINLSNELPSLQKEMEELKNRAKNSIESFNKIQFHVQESIKILNFLIYAPENHFLRRFEEEAAIKPLGIKGEGLFKLITIIAQEHPDQFNEIKQHLKLIDWFEYFEIPGDLKFTERRIKIKDQYLADDLQYFDQRSANEGFLYLLFYLTLFVSDLTPHFFAIDNIDNSLNPKLGSELIKVLAKLSKDHNKQALLTTHNPVILDGLDLNDDDQRLFVVYRNADGHTKVRRIPAQKALNGIEPVRLSEAFIRGYIGGLPKNF